MTIRRPQMFEQAACGKINNIFLQILVFALVFSIISTVESIVPSIMMIAEFMEVLRDMGTDAVAQLTPEQIMSLITDITAQTPIMLTMLMFTGLGTILAIIYCRFIEKRPISSMGFVKKHAVRDYLVGLVVGFVMFSAVIGVSVLFGAISIDGLNAQVNIGVILLFFVGYLIQGMSEEVICRGYLMNSIGGKYHMALAVAISSVIFSLMHTGNPGATPLALLNIALVGAFFALYMICFDNIWGACAIHSIWNFTQGHFFGVSVSGMANSESLLITSANDELTLINGGSFGAEGGFSCTIVLLLSLAALFIFMAKTGRLTLGKNKAAQ